MGEYFPRGVYSVRGDYFPRGVIFKGGERR